MSLERMYHNGVEYIRADMAERELDTMAETLRIVQARCTELLEEVRRLRPKPIVCQCLMVAGKRYSHCGCLAFHTVKAVGFVNGDGEPVDGNFFGIVYTEGEGR
jgi:hypothetical protein